jgi:hypothetical protein
MKTFFTWLAAALVSAAVLIGCGGGSDGAAPAPAGATLTGEVVSMDSGAPVAGASVSAGGKRTQTGADGGFALSGLAASERLAVQVEGPAHGGNVAWVQLSANGKAALQVRLLPLSAPRRFDAEAGMTLFVAESVARAQVPALTLVDAATGVPAVGPATGSVTSVDPARDADRLPSGYTTLQDGGLRTIESYGAIQVELRGDAGRRLNLAPDSIARVWIPLSTRSPQPPAVAPLFYLDETSGHWVQQGEARLRRPLDSAAYYEGHVSHYSDWSVGHIVETVDLAGCVANADGSPAAGVIVNASGIDHSGRSSATTGSQGRFVVSLRKNASVSLWATADKRATPITALTVGNTSGDIAGACMKLGAPPLPGQLAPQIMLAPTDTTVADGEAALLQVVVEGTQPMHFEWRRNGLPIAGSNTSSLWIPATSPTDNGARFSVTASNAAGSVTSAEARLTIAITPMAPIITAQPQSATAVEGDPASFGVSVQGSRPLSYQWLRNGTPIAGATQASFQITATPGQNAALFSVEVSNALGEVTSQAATLTVLSPEAAPVITAQPVSIATTAGSSASFSVTAVGSGPISYQWQRNGANIPGGIGAVLIIPMVSTSDDGAQYRAIVDNNRGSVASDAATLSVSDRTPAQLRGASH